MSYIGRGIDQIDNISTLDNLSFNGSDATFNLTQNSVAFVPVSADALQIQIDGVIQSGNYTVSGSTVTFDFTPSGSSVCNGIKHFGVGVLTTVSDGAITEAKIGSGAVTSSKIASGVIPTSRPNANPLIINGNMAVAQRGTSTSSVTSSSYHTIDRFRTNFSGTLGTWTQSQSTNVPTGKGFANSFKMDCTTADASPSVADRLSIRYNFEGQDLQLLKKGISDAEKITLAFWVKSSKTGVHIVNIVDQDNTRHISKSYTVSSSNTWEQVVLNFDGDTTGTLDDDNGQSLYIDFYLGAGTNYTSGTLATSWEAKNNVNTAVGQVNLADSTSNEWYITGIQLEVGEYTSSTLPPFQHESYGDNKQRCMRYYQNSYKLGNALTSTSGNNAVVVTSWNDGNCPFPNMFPVPMRDEPTVTLRPRGSTTTGQINSNGTDRSATATDVSEKGVSYITVTSGTALTYSGFTFELETEL
jgi:hypothetical protein